MGRMAPVPLHLRVAVSVPPLALFDPSRVRRVLANGLSNAAKLSADAPILILAHAEQTSTNSSLLEESRSGGTLQLQVRPCSRPVKPVASSLIPVSPPSVPTLSSPRSSAADR